MATNDTGQLVVAPTLQAAPEGTVAVPRAPKRRVWTRAWQWFWRSQAMAAARQQRPSGARAELVRRARVASEMARRILASPEPFPGSVQAPVADLFRQSIHWSLRALAADSSAPPAQQPGASRWDVIHPTLQLKAAPSPEAFAEVKRAVDSFAFEDLAALLPEEQGRLVTHLGLCASAFLEEAQISDRLAEALWTQRFLRVGLMVALLLVVAGAIAFGRDSSERAHDLAHGKAWKLSSSYGVNGCTSPAQDCVESPDYFFHTQEEKEPWVEIDLGSKQRFSAVRAINRKDCCTDRGVPLVVEVSSDDVHWKEVARREPVFTSWLATFSPIDARYVRLHVAAKGILHLSAVRVMP